MRIILSIALTLFAVTCFADVFVDFDQIETEQREESEKILNEIEELERLRVEKIEEYMTEKGK